MKHIFLDTNILLDLVQQREHFEDAVTILQCAYDKKIEIAASTLSFANIAYILRKLPQEQLYELLSRLSEDVPMLPLTPADIMNAISHPVKDFEDMLQYQCALAADCDVVVTNNKKDFHEFCRIPILTSEEFELYGYLLRMTATRSPLNSRGVRSTPGLQLMGISTPTGSPNAVDGAPCQGAFPPLSIIRRSYRPTAIER